MVSNHPEPEENNLLVNLIAIGVFLFVAWKVLWPAIKANNILQKPLTHYGKPEGTGRYNRFSPMEALLFAILFNIIETGIFIYYRIVNVPIVYHYGRHEYSPGMLFSISLIAVVSLLIYTYMDASEFSMLRDFRFAVKTWLTAIFLSPALLLLIFNCKILQIRPIPYTYPTMIIMAHGFGVFVFVTLLISANYFSKKTWPITKKRWFIFLSTQIMLIINAPVLITFLHLGSTGLIAWFVYALIIGLGTKFYAMNTIIYTDETIDPINV